MKTPQNQSSILLWSAGFHLGWPLGQVGAHLAREDPSSCKSLCSTYCCKQHSNSAKRPGEEEVSHCLSELLSSNTHIKSSQSSAARAQPAPAWHPWCTAASRDRAIQSHQELQSLPEDEPQGTQMNCTPEPPLSRDLAALWITTVAKGCTGLLSLPGPQGCPPTRQPWDDPVLQDLPSPGEG